MGGGAVGERKVRGLLECGAGVAVVSRELTPYLQRMKDQGIIEHDDADYDVRCLNRAFIVIGATDSEEINRRISTDARERCVLVNIADDPAQCDFILPSVFRQGDLAIVVSTGGKSPALAKKLREELDGHFGQEYGHFLQIMGDLREAVLALGNESEENKKLFEALVKSDLLQLIKEKNWEGAKNCIHKITGLAVELAGDACALREKG
ncbi:MAG: bifunctional precorrin-2 dehydrogenase/sirohydrochlorin ferrochelatase [Syntrophales bacterium LBB04]|nr:bifunctional precorrin-2 dehydrogenase/sirohydrochlorin ferrochelatase [Syntrophales bacterium LBB04]